MESPVQFLFALPSVKKSTKTKILLIGLAVLGSWFALHAILLIVRPTPKAIAEQQCTLLCEALEIFARDCGRYPSTKQGLYVLLENQDIPNWHGPYLMVGRGTTPFRDQWGQELLYRNEGARIHVISAGPDREFDTADDIDIQAIGARPPVPFKRR